VDWKTQTQRGVRRISVIQNSQLLPKIYAHCCWNCDIDLLFIYLYLLFFFVLVFCTFQQWFCLLTPQFPLLTSLTLSLLSTGIWGTPIKHLQVCSPKPLFSSLFYHSSQFILHVNHQKNSLDINPLSLCPPSHHSPSLQIIPIDKMILSFSSSSVFQFCGVYTCLCGCSIFSKNFPHCSPIMLPIWSLLLILVCLLVNALY
jgi:hypothetical protein